MLSLAREKLSEIDHGPPIAALIAVAYSAVIFRVLFAEQPSSIPVNLIGIALFLSVPVLYGLTLGFTGKGRAHWIVHLVVAALIGASFILLGEPVKSVVFVFGLALAAPLPIIGVGAWLSGKSSWPVNRKLGVSLFVAAALAIIAVAADKKGLIQRALTIGCPPAGSMPE